MILIFLNFKLSVQIINIIEKITFCFVLSFYMAKIDLFSLSIIILFVVFCIPGTCAFYSSWEKEIFFSISYQMINVHAAF